MSPGQHFEDLSKHSVTNRAAEVEDVAAPVIRAQIEADADPEQFDPAGGFEPVADEPEVMV